MNWLKNYWGLLALGAVIVAVASMGGCAGGIRGWLEDNTKVSVPEQLRGPNDGPTKPLSDAVADFESKAAALVRYGNEIELANETVARWESVFGWLGGQIEVAAGEIPGWGVFGGATGLGLLLGAVGVKQPGTERKLKLAEDKGYDMGRSEALESVKKAVSS